jgi:F-type H+/Na+-transporting ATPase subunit beta
MSQNGQSAHVGTIVEIKGVVVDAVFHDEMPAINNALEIQVPAADGQTSGRTLVAEVQQHMGDGRVRTIAMDATDGLSRGLEVIDTGGPITVPVGEVTLGRIFNVLGEVIDNGEPLGEVDRWPIHRDPPAFDTLSPTTEIFETGIKVIDLLAP